MKPKSGLDLGLERPPEMFAIEHNNQLVLVSNNQFISNLITKHFLVMIIINEKAKICSVGTL